MHINYENNEVKNLCTKKEYALKHIDSKVYTALKFVINFIENATSLIDVINYPSFHFHDLLSFLVDFFSLFCLHHYCNIASLHTT